MALLGTSHSQLRVLTPELCRTPHAPEPQFVDSGGRHGVHMSGYRGDGGGFRFAHGQHSSWCPEFAYAIHQVEGNPRCRGEEVRVPQRVATLTTVNLAASSCL